MPDVPNWVKEFRKKAWAAEIPFLEIEATMLYELWIGKMNMIQKAKLEAGSLVQKR
jgi:hypothetical protein